MPPIPRSEIRQLQKTIDAVVNAVNAGHLAWEDGTFGSDHMADLMVAQLNVAAALARFEDRQFVLDAYTTDFMRVYEMMATDLMEGMVALEGERREERLRLPTGQYAVSRKLLLGDRLYEEARVCANPAVAAVYLDQWEREVRNSMLNAAA